MPVQCSLLVGHKLKTGSLEANGEYRNAAYFQEGIDCRMATDRRANISFFLLYFFSPDYWDLCLLPLLPTMPVITLVPHF